MTIEELEKESKRIVQAKKYVSDIELMKKSLELIRNKETIQIEITDTVLHLSYKQGDGLYTINHCINNGHIRLKQDLVGCFNEVISDIEKELEAL